MHKKCSIHAVSVMLFLALGTGMHGQTDVPKIPKGALIPAPEIITSTKTGGNEVIAEVIFREDFETGGRSWEVAGGASIAAPAGGPRAGHNSSLCAVTNPTESYSNNAEAGLISPRIPLPFLANALSQLKLRSWEWFEIESGWDHGRVEVSTDDGRTWKQVSSRSGKSGWREASIDISAYAGRTINIRFHLTTDESETFSGWFIDDVQIILYEPQQLAATMVSLNPQNFPFIYMSISVTRDGNPVTDLTESAFQVYENDVPQTENLRVTPPDEGGGVRLADIVFLMDNSGSMGEEIDAISNNVIDFVNGLSQSGVDFSLGLCRFGAWENNGSPIIEDNGQLTSDANYFKNTVWARNVIDGGFEPGWDALYASATGFSFRPGSQKVFILITDETATGDGNIGAYSKSQAISVLQSNSVTLFALVETGDSYAQQDYCEITTATNGQCFNIYTPFDEILDFITSEVSSTYLVQYKSSDPELNGLERTVEVLVTHEADVATATGSYIPGAAPEIQRTAATLALHDRSWEPGTEFTIEVEIKDEAEPDVESATLFYRRVGDVSFIPAPMSEAFEDIYQGKILAGIVDSPGVQYYITATDGVSTSSDPSVDPVNEAYMIGILPNVAPEITHDVVTEAQPGNPIFIQATIIDETNDVKFAQLFYRVYGELLYASADMNDIGDDVFQGAIPEESVTEDGIEYYIYAEDDFGVGTYHGTPDAPHFIETESEFSAYLSLKQVLISTILGMNRPFYGTSWPFAFTAETRAGWFVNSVQQQFDEGKADNIDLEAIARLYLSETVYGQAYGDAISISLWGARGLRAITFSWVCGAVFKRVIPWAESFAARFPRVGEPLLKTLNRIIDKINATIYRLLLAYQNGLQFPSGQLTLGQWAEAQGATNQALSQALGRITRSTASWMDSKAFDKDVFDHVDSMAQDYVFLNPLDVLTKGKQETAVDNAQLHNFTPGTFEEASGDVTDVLSDMISANNNMNNAGLFSETVRQTGVAVALAGALSLVVAGILSAVFTGGLSLIAALAGAGAVMTAYGSMVSSYSAIIEAGSVGIHIDAILPFVYMRPSVDYAFGIDSKAQAVGGEEPQLVSTIILPVGYRGSYAKPDHSEQVFEYYQRLRDMIQAGDTTWATTGIDSLNYYEHLARRDEDLTIADFMASMDSAWMVISGHAVLVNSYLRKTAAREMYSAALDIHGLVFSTESTDSSVIKGALAALDSTIVNYPAIQSLRSAVYDSLEARHIPIPTAVGIGGIEYEVTGANPGRATLDVEVINFGSEPAQLIQVYPSLTDENGLSRFAEFSIEVRDYSPAFVAA